MKLPKWQFKSFKFVQRFKTAVSFDEFASSECGEIILVQSECRHAGVQHDFFTNFGPNLQDL
jgi:hypothetical protein